MNRFPDEITDKRPTIKILASFESQQQKLDLTKLLGEQYSIIRTDDKKTNKSHYFKTEIIIEEKYKKF